MALIIQLLFDGLAMGLVFILLATGLVLISSVNRMLFMAYAMFYTLGAYITWLLFQRVGVPYLAAVLGGVLFAAALGSLAYIFIFRRVQATEGGFLATLIASMGLNMVLEKGNLLIFGTAPKNIPTAFKGILEIGGLSMTADKLVLIFIGVGITGLLFLVYEKTRLGRAMRSVAISPDVAQLMGVNTVGIYVATMAIGTGLAGLAGGILAPSYGISPSMGGNVLWTVMLMTMLGGMDSMIGAVIGGIVIGEMLSFGQYFIGSTIEIVVFLFIGVVLYFKPHGLLGKGIDIGL